MRKKTLPGTTSTSHGLAQTLKDVGLEATLHAFEIAFPAVHLTVEVEVADLSFTHYLADADAGEGFLVTALTDHGERWLDDNTERALPDEDQETLPAGKAWMASQAEFNHLLDDATSDGLVVSLETVDSTT